MFIKKYFPQILHLLIISISLHFAVFLLLLNVSQVLASEVSFNTKISVKLPEPQSGNPGEFVTLVLELENRDNLPVTIEATCSNEWHWNLLFDSNLTVEPHSQGIFPISVQIPENAPAGSETSIQVSFNITNSSPFPAIRIPVKVNPISSIDFQVNANTGRGAAGSTVQYNMVVTNHGNTTEQFLIRSHSEHRWKTTIQPENFRLAPGESHDILIHHNLPANSPIDSDQLTVTFHWNQNQKIVILTSMIDSPLDNPTGRFYLWQGNFSLYHPDLTGMNANPVSNSFSLKGPIAPETSGEFYFTDLLNSNRRWFFDYQSRGTDIRMGEFWLPWSGCMAPPSSLGNLQITGNLADHHYTFYAWQPAGENQAVPLGINAVIDDHSACSFLYYSDPTNPQSVLEWNYRNSFPDGLLWTHALAYNVARPDNFGYNLALQGKITDWNWVSSYKYVKNYFNYGQKRNVAVVLNRPPSESRLNSQEYQLQYEFAEPNSDAGYYDFLLTAAYYWAPDWQLMLSQKYHFPDNAALSSNTSLFMQANWVKNPFTHHYWINISIDNTEGDPSNYIKMDWTTAYALNFNSDFIVNPQLIHNSLASIETETVDCSRLGLGYKKRWDYGPEFTAMYYHLFNSSYNQNLTLTLDWPIYQYHFIFTYSGFIKQNAIRTETCSLGFRQNFTWPVRKPLGGVEGIAFLDVNGNGVFDNDEPRLPKLELLLDQERPITSDNNGHFILSGLTPGEHRITLNPRLEAIYLPVIPETKIQIKPYQTLQRNIPFIRTRNIMGLIYQDRNQNRAKDDNEAGLAGITVILTANGQEVDRSTTDDAGAFIFYQLMPQNYQISIEQSGIPEESQLPADFVPLDIEAGHLLDLPTIMIGVIPVTRPIEIITEALPKLEFTLNPELIYTGHNLYITMTSSTPLQSLILFLPDQTQIKLAVSPNQTQWSYRWKVPNSSATGQLKIKAVAVDINGNSLQAEANCIILVPQ
jgi:hypothetical protein